MYVCRQRVAVSLPIISRLGTGTVDVDSRLGSPLLSVRTGVVNIKEWVSMILYVRRKPCSISRAVVYNGLYMYICIEWPASIHAIPQTHVRDPLTVDLRP